MPTLDRLIDVAARFAQLQAVRQTERFAAVAILRAIAGLMGATALILLLIALYLGLTSVMPAAGALMIVGALVAGIGGVLLIAARWVRDRN